MVGESTRESPGSGLGNGSCSSNGQIWCARGRYEEMPGNAGCVVLGQDRKWEGETYRRVGALYGALGPF